MAETLSDSGALLPAKSLRLNQSEPKGESPGGDRVAVALQLHPISSAARAIEIECPG